MHESVRCLIVFVDQSTIQLDLNLCVLLRKGTNSVTMSHAFEDETLPFAARHLLKRKS